MNQDDLSGKGRALGRDCGIEVGHHIISSIPSSAESGRCEPQI